MIVSKIYANKQGFDAFNTICIITGGSSGIGKALIKQQK